MRNCRSRRAAELAGYFEEASLSVHGILIRKGATVFTVEPTDLLANAAKSLTNHGIGALVVTDAEGHTVGIISERTLCEH